MFLGNTQHFTTFSSKASPSSPSPNQVKTLIPPLHLRSIKPTFTTMSAFVPIPLSSPSCLSRTSLTSSARTMLFSNFTHSFAIPPYCTPTPSTCSPFVMRLDTPSSDSLTPLVSDSRRRHLHNVITSSPVFQSADLSISTTQPQPTSRARPDATCLDHWIQMGSILERALGRQANDVRVYQYYLPIYFWILKELETHNVRLAEEQRPHRPLILGFSCPQGGGKTTMTTFLETLLRSTGKNVQIASIDDFYVTNKEQRNIAQSNPDNRLIQYRGMPGTHDLDLLNHTLDRLREGATDVSIPRYDKTAFSGRGDRAPVDKWKHLSDTTDILLLEGWCLGFEPVDKENLIHPDLHIVNEALKDFLPIYKKMDALFVIEISNMEWVFDWRLQAERGTRASGRPGLTDEQVIDFVSRFMPAYKQYSSQLYNRPTPLVPNHELHIEIDSQRKPVKINRKPPLRG